MEIENIPAEHRPDPGRFGPDGKTLKRFKWTNEEDMALKLGAEKEGVGNVRVFSINHVLDLLTEIYAHPLFHSFDCSGPLSSDAFHENYVIGQHCKSKIAYVCRVDLRLAVSA